MGKWMSIDRRRALLLAAMPALSACAGPALRHDAAVPGPWPRSRWFDLASRHTGQRYRIVLGLPLRPPPAAGHPVLWALDGLASFPLLALERPRAPQPDDSPLLRRRDAADPDGLIVGVGYASGEPFDLHARALDYTPGGSGPTGDLLSPRHGGDEAFSRFLVDELRPLLAQQWPLDAGRQSLFGFSYGGLFTLRLLCRQPQHFQRWFAASPSLWFRGHLAMRPWADLPPPDYRRHPARVHLWVGQDEQHRQQFDSDPQRERLQARRMVDNARDLAALLAAQPGLAVALDVVPGRDHLDMLAHAARQVPALAFGDSLSGT